MHHAIIYVSPKLYENEMHTDSVRSVWVYHNWRELVVMPWKAVKQGYR